MNNPAVIVSDLIADLDVIDQQCGIDTKEKIQYLIALLDKHHDPMMEGRVEDWSKHCVICASFEFQRWDPS